MFTVRWATVNSSHPLPSSTRGLATTGDRPVEDLEARLLCLLCLFPGVHYLKLYIVFVRFCATSLTTDKTFTTGDGALEIYKLTTKQHDSKD